MKERERLTQEFALALHTAEVSSLVSEINFKSHVAEKRSRSLRTAFYLKTVDVFRYLLAILNLWGFTAEDFSLRLSPTRKTTFRVKYVKNAQKWEGQPVVLVDADDVIVHFRKGYSEYLKQLWKVFPSDVYFQRILLY